MTKTHLLIIDPQNDFCESDGALSVPSADADMVRLATFINKNLNNISDISVTLDSHHTYDISHPHFWYNSETNEKPEPFTIITSESLKEGTWKTFDKDFDEFAMAYVSKLEEKDKYPLCIWPPHCLMGTHGHNIFGDVQTSLQLWEGENNQVVNYILKGLNPYTEHYSALKAEIPLVEDTSTTINTRLVSDLNEAETILIAGQASSHCVANTYYDLIDYLPTLAPRIVILKDTMSAVPGFEEFETNFFNSVLENKSMLSTTKDFVLESNEEELND